MQRLGKSAHDFADKRTPLLDRLLARHDGVDVVGNLERADIDQVSETHLLCFAHQWFPQERKLRDIARQRREPLRVFSRGDDLRIFFRVDAEPPQCKA